MIFPGFVGGSYESASPLADCQRTVNLYPEIVESGNGKNRTVLYARPGRKRFVTLPDYPVRGLFTEPKTGRAFAVGGHRCFEVLSDARVKYLGDVAAVGPVGFASNGLHVIVTVGKQGYVIDLSTGGFRTISSPALDGMAFPVFLDGYLAVIDPATQKYAISGIYDATAWDGLDFASAEACPDGLVSMLADHRELWLFGSRSTEVHYNSGNPDFPFEPIRGALIEQGCAAAQSPVKADNSILWIGENERGGRVAWRANGYTPQRVSTHAVEAAWAKYPTVADAIGHCCVHNGHEFVVWSFPSANPHDIGIGGPAEMKPRGATWVYDCATGLWTEWGYWDALHGIWRADRARFHCYAFGRHLVGDYLTGRVYEQSPEYLDDDGEPRGWLRRFPHICDEKKRVFYRSLELDVETGTTDAQVILRWSNDGGRTWSNDRAASIGKLGEYGCRVRWNMLGMGRDRVFEVSGSDPVKLALINAYLDIEQGTY